MLALRDGRRCYLQYIAVYENDGVTEDVQRLPMTDERYPSFNFGGIDWDDEVGNLNRLLTNRLPPN